MAFHTYRLEHFKKLSSGDYDTTPVYLDNIITISVNLQAGTSADSLQFTLFNDGVGNDMESIRIDDRVKVYGSLDGVNFTQIIDGIINEKKQSSDINGSFITISCLNRLEKLFNALVSTTGESIQHSASYWVANIIRQVNGFNRLGGNGRDIKYIYNGKNENGVYVGGTDTITETTEIISFVRGFERAFGLISELAEPDYTDGQNYIFYLDNDNYFHFEVRPSINGATLTFGDDILSQRTTKGMFDIVNYIIMNGGKSPRGMSILQMDYNPESIAKYGWKVKLVNEGLASAMATDEIRLMRMRNAYDEDEPNFPSSYPFTTSWGTTTTSNSDYNSDFVDEILARAKIRIRQLLDKNGGASYKSDISVLPSFNYGLYNKHRLIITFNGIGVYYNWDTGIVLRIDSINYNFSEQGWTTDISLSQDPEDIVGES